MEDTIDDFFNEIDQIAPPKESNKGGCDWQECFDSGSGYPYYWNIKTDQVTWDIPLEFKTWKEQNPNSNVEIQKSRIAPLFPSALPTITKIYNIQTDVPNISLDNHSLNDKEKPSINLSTNSVKAEKVALIPSYGDGSDSEAEIDKETKSDLASSPLPPKRLKENCTHSLKNNEDDDNDLITKLQNRAQILKDLGGELPPDVKKIVEQNGSFNKKDNPHKVKKEVSGFSLVAGYGDSEDEDESTFIKPSNAIISPVSESQTVVSTLFPIAKPIDIKQFLETDKEPETETIDTKAFHRKRRIGIDFNLEKPKSDVIDSEVERQGLGFKSENEVNVNNNEKPKINYSGFQSGGLIFVNSDILNPVSHTDKTESDSDTNKQETMKMIEETHKTLNEKLTFLSEGRDPVSPVQVIIIQMETLYEAMQSGSLTVTYLHKWLKETCSELVKLEKDAAPSGWLLQWDRINKRYYYRNQQTGESQWEYPQPDIVGGDEAMDICTTPPPPVTESIISERVAPLPAPLPIRPPPPPRIKSPTPPPPPIISKNIKQPKKVKPFKHTPLPKEDLPLLLPNESLPTGLLPNDEPLPPGVDVTQEVTFSEEKQVPKKDALGLELNSFYSDLAAMETGVTSSESEPCSNVPINQAIDPTTTTVTKKKKKCKVKLVEGLAMKKKGVSKLVERWKNVQKDYN